jgi:hypothetical protein
MSIRSNWITTLGLAGAIAVGGLAGCAALDDTDDLDESGVVDEGADIDEGVNAGENGSLDVDGLATDGRTHGNKAVKSAWCAEGWHEHVVTWPSVGRAQGPCREHVGTIPLGRHVCMLNAAAAVCNGQGYTQVYLLETESPMNDWLWSRTEAFNGH